MEWLSSSLIPAVKICTDSWLSSYLHSKQSNHRSYFKLYWFKYYFRLWVIIFNQEIPFEHKCIQCNGNNLVQEQFSLTHKVNSTINYKVGYLIFKVEWLKKYFLVEHFNLCFFCNSFWSLILEIYKIISQ